MNEYIEREEVIKAAMNNKAVCQCLADIVDVRDIVNCVPAADVVPIVHGYWIQQYLGYGAYRYKCSICGGLFGENMIDAFQHNQYCADCGAKMDREQK